MLDKVREGVRQESDLLGELSVPASAYWGVHTQRASDNFTITGQRLADTPDVLRAIAAVKQAAARANRELGVLCSKRAEAIIAACIEIRNGALHDHFLVDLMQGGAGTSTNMNANEVIANRALELMGHRRGDYKKLHPNEHVNLGQSTNDVYPTALRLALWSGAGRLLEALAGLRDAFEERSVAFANILKIGRTQLQDAVPMTLGQEFAAFERTIGEAETAIGRERERLCEINLGGTAIGTGLMAHPDYSGLACMHLADISGIPVKPASDLIAATSDCGVLVALSGALKRAAVIISKICNDLRLLSSGPRAGLAEINLPPMQAGSSIMPGKINPVIPEVVNQVAFEVIGNDVTVTLAAEAGQLQLNAFEPVIFYSMHRSIFHLTNACETLNHKCVRGITANVSQLQSMVSNTIGIVTAISALIGYESATSIAIEAQATGKSVRALVLERGLATATELDRLLSSEALTSRNAG